MALDLLLRQDYMRSDFEIIVVDNNSKDRTKEVVDKYIIENPGLSIHYVFKPNQGLVYARQKKRGIVR